MKYGRCDGSSRWHMIVKDLPLCAGHLIAIVETKESEDVLPEDRCGNCEERLADKGRELKKRAPRKYVKPSKSDYNPRHKFKE